MIETSYYATNHTVIDDQLLEEHGIDPVLEIRRNGVQVANPDREGVTYTISEIDSRPKWSEEAQGCLLACYVGKTIEGDTLTMLAHLTPAFFSRTHANMDLLMSAVEDFVSATPTDRIALIAGGIEDEGLEERHPQNYYNMLRILTDSHKSLGLTTQVVQAKQSMMGKTNVYVDGGQVYIIDSEATRSSEKISPIKKPIDIIQSSE